MTRLKEQHTAAMDNLTKQFAQERSSLRKECDELIAKNAILQRPVFNIKRHKLWSINAFFICGKKFQIENYQRDVETLKTENITLKSQPSQMNMPSYPPPVPPELQPPPGPPPFMSQNIYCYGNILRIVVLYHNIFFRSTKSRAPSTPRATW